MQHRVVEHGHGLMHAKNPGGLVEFHYQGLLSHGGAFTSTYDNGHTIKVLLPRAIPCWNEALRRVASTLYASSARVEGGPSPTLRAQVLPQMVEGDVWDVWCPSEIAYGDHNYPHVPGGSSILFKIEMHHVYGETKPTTKCLPATEVNCTDKEKAYVEKMRGRDADGGFLEPELDRLLALEDNGHFTEVDLDWLHIRQTLLRKMIALETARPEL